MFHSAEYHFGVLLEILVDRHSVCCFAEFYPIGNNVKHFLALLQEDYIGSYLCSGIGEKSIVRQAYSTDKLRSLREILAELRIELIKCSFGSDESHNTARANLVECLCKEMVVYAQMQLIIPLFG